MEKPTTYAWPASLVVKDLKHHPDYSPDKIRRYEALYSAGEMFRDCLDEFLTKRQIEDAAESGVGGSKHYELRKKVARLVPRGSGLIDWLVAAAFKQEPRIVCSGGTAEQKEFWEGLNKDVDGVGTDLPAYIRRGARGVLLHGRAAFTTNFVHPESKAGDKESAKVRFGLLQARNFDDWEYARNGQLLWIRTRYCEDIRIQPWLQPEETRDLWTFITASQIAEYEWRHKRGAAPADKDIASGIAKQHEFGSVPVYPIRAGCEVWVMERIYDVLIALFNREVSITWALDNLAYALLVLNLNESDPKSIIATEIAAMMLKIGETAGFISPPATTFEPLFKDGERLKQALYEVIQALAINAAATQTQNARQSAQAKEIDRDPLHTLLAAIVWPAKDALETQITDLKRFRNEPTLKVEVEGMNTFDATMSDAKEVIEQGPSNSDSPEPKKEQPK